jgi:hypothetical protein
VSSTCSLVPCSLLPAFLCRPPHFLLAHLCYHRDDRSSRSPAARSPDPSEPNAPATGAI